MNGTLFALDLLDSPAGFALALAIGILFGFFLEQAGFGSSRRLTGVFYFKDMAVVKVMFTAVVTAMVGYRYLVALGWLNPADVHVLDTFWTSQIAGGLLFGVGFVMGGWCPGTAFVGVASGKLDALVFLGGAILGSIAFNEVFPLLQPAYDRCAGPLHLPGTLGLSDAILVLAFCLVAVLAFAGCTRIERAGGAPPPNPVSLRRNRLAALALVLLALGVFALPQPAPRGVVAPIDTQGPAEPQAEVSAPSASALADGLGAVALAQDHIAPADLAAALMSGEPGLSVIDVRPADDYRAFHLPGAIHLPVDRLLAEAGARVARSGRVVLCSNGTTHAAQAWLALRVAGWTNVLVLTDGMLGFWRECLTPPSLQPGADPRAAEAARAGFEARRP